MDAIKEAVSGVRDVVDEYVRGEKKVQTSTSVSKRTEVEACTGPTKARAIYSDCNRHPLLHPYIPMRKEFPAENYSRLEMTLNLSVFHYEILDAPEKALQLAKETLCDAQSGLVSLDERSSQKTRRIVQWLRDIVLRWTSNAAAGEASAKPLDDDIKSLIETKLRSVKPSALNLEDLWACLNPVTTTAFHNDTGALREFLEKKCTSFVSIEVIDKQIVAFYKPSPATMSLQKLTRHFEVIYTEARRLRIIA